MAHTPERSVEPRHGRVAPGAVVIKTPRWKLALLPAIPILMYGLAMAALLVAAWCNPGAFRAGPDAVRPGGGALVRLGTKALLWLVGVWAGGFALGLWLAPPEFEVRHDGLRLGNRRVPANLSGWRISQMGLYRWDEIRSCHWSPYKAGVLVVCFAGASGHARNGLFKEPAWQSFHRIPEAYRGAVEQALMAHGKWQANA